MHSLFLPRPLFCLVVYLVDIYLTIKYSNKHTCNSNI